MAELVQADIRTKVRRALMQITFTGEVATAEHNVEDLASTRFSDLDLNRRINDAARYVAARVRAEVLEPLIESGSDSTYTDYEILRVLGSRVERSGVKAHRKSFLGNRTRRVAPSPTYPIYVYEDTGLDVLPTGGTVTVDVVRVPGSEGGEAIQEIPEIFEEPVIQRTLFSCYHTLGQYPLAVSAQERVNSALSNFRLPFFKK